MDDALTSVHAAAMFVARFFVSLSYRPYHPTEVLRQCYEIGFHTLPLVSLTGLITGIVFTQQSRPSLESFGATSWLPSLAIVGIVRALAPLVTALVAAGKVGSSIGAELGSMRVTEQIDAMEVSAVDPFKYLVVTRTLATTMMIPLLSLYFAAVAILGSFINVAANEHTSWDAFMRNGFETIGFLDLWSAVGLRAVTFGFTIGLVACYCGYNATGGTQGVGRASNAAVVRAMLFVFIEEVMMVQIVNALRTL